MTEKLRLIIGFLFRGAYLKLLERNSLYFEHYKFMVYNGPVRDTLISRDFYFIFRLNKCVLVL